MDRKVKALRRIMDNGYLVKRGAEVPRTVPAAYVEEWLSRGWAEAVEPAPKPKATAPKADE